MATWRWRRWSRRGPEQPNRVVLRWRAQSVVMTSAFGAMVTWIATGALGSLTAAFSAGMVVAGVVMLPGALAAWRWSAGAPEDLAAVDLLWVAATGRPPKQDQRVPAAVPAGSPEAQHGTSLVDLVRIDPDRSALG